MSGLVEKTNLEGLLLMSPRSFEDTRGYLAETYDQERYRQFGIHANFVLDIQSYSNRNVLRGLHAQIKHPQAKLVRAVAGEIYDVAVDMRRASPTFGQWHGDILSGPNLKQLFIPEGFLHGFYVLSDYAIVHYKCSDVYVADDQLGVLWNDPELGIRWPAKTPTISEKDQKNISWGKLKQMLKDV